MTDSLSDVKLAVALRESNHTLQPLAFLFDSYEPRYWWWEVSVCIERLLLTNFSIYLYNQPVLQPFIVLAITLVFVKFYSHFDPYTLDSDDLFAEISRWAIVANVILLIIIKVHEEMGIKIPAATYAMLMMILLTVFGVFICFCLQTINADMSAFKRLAKYLLSEATKETRRRFSQKSVSSPTGEEGTGAMEIQPGQNPESAWDWALTRDSGIDIAMFPTEDEKQCEELPKFHEADIDQDENDALGLHSEYEPALFEI